MSECGRKSQAALLATGESVRVGSANVAEPEDLEHGEDVDAATDLETSLRNLLGNSRGEESVLGVLRHPPDRLGQTRRSPATYIWQHRA